MNEPQRKQDMKENNAKENNFKENNAKENNSKEDDIIEKAIIIACILGIIITLIIVLMNNSEERFSVLYIQSDSYSNYVEGNTVSFTYGVECLEGKATQYNLKIFLGDEIVDEKEFMLGEGEKTENGVTIDIPQEIEFPVKLGLLLEVNDREYDTHFWLKGR